jgi:Domain of unknown function (DUF4357)
VALAPQHAASAQVGRYLSEDGGRLVFTRNFEFASPSAAAAVVHGGHTNGLTAWKTSEGKTLKDVESAKQPVTAD